MNLNELTYNKLLSFYSDDGIERGGYLKGNEVIEVENDHINPLEGFSFSCDSLEMLEDDEVIATFHTHPNGEKNLSKQDCEAFKNWANLLHFIVGKDGISCYKVSERNTILIEEINVCKD